MRITVEEQKTKTACSNCGTMFCLAVDVDMNKTAIVECPHCNVRYAIVVDIALVSLEPEKIMTNAKTVINYLALKYHMEKLVEAEIAGIEREAESEKVAAGAGE